MDYCSLSIWGIGPGRPYDNAYVLKNVSFEDNILRLFFNNEEGVIYNPRNISVTANKFTIDEADKIEWFFHLYGLPETYDTFVATRYTKVNSGWVHVLSNGILKEECIPSFNKVAFDFVGNTDLIVKHLSR